MLRFRDLLGLLPLPLLAACAGPGPVATTVAALPAAVEPAGGPADEPVASGWPEADSCGGLIRQLAGLDPAARRGLDPLTAPITLVGVGPLQPGLERDLPIPLAASATGAPGPCLLLVGAPEALPAAADRVLDERVVHSTYQDGSRRWRNPDHRALERDLAAAKRAPGEDFDLLATGDPLLDLLGTVAGGVIGGLGRIGAEREINDLETALAATPAYLEQPTEATYRYDLVELEAERRSSLPIALFDRASGTTIAVELTRTERQLFALANDHHPRDLQPSPVPGAALATTATLAAWRAGSPTLTTGALVEHIAAALVDGAEARPASLGETLAELRRAPLPGPFAVAGTRGRAGRAPVPAAIAHPLAEGLVEVGGKGGARGFYVTAEHIAAPVSALGESSLVAVRYPDGMAAYGMVELVDDELGLALIYLPRHGEAPERSVAERAPPPAPTARTNLPPGVPWVDDDRVVGLFVVDALTAEPRWVSAAELDRFVGRLQTL
ncbi:MAG: hypothetical protein R3D25_13710 [Geminicoccaceae bacterium]